MRVLIAYGGGDAGDKTLAAVAPWAQSSGAEVHLVKVLKPKGIHETALSGAVHDIAPSGTPTGALISTGEPVAHLAQDRSQAFVAARREAEEQLHVVGERAFGTPDITVHVQIADEVASSIVALATKIEAAVIAIGTHSRTGIQHAILGSVAEAVVRTAAVPVIVVGPHVLSAPAGRMGQP